MLEQVQRAKGKSLKTSVAGTEALERQTVTRRELSRAVNSACPSLSQSQASMIVDQVLEEISETLIQGETVTLCNFGKFVVVSKKERKGRNPRTGDFAVVAPRKVASFRASKHLKAVIAREAPFLKMAGLV